MRACSAVSLKSRFEQLSRTRFRRRQDQDPSLDQHTTTVPGPRSREPMLFSDALEDGAAGPSCAGVGRRVAHQVQHLPRTSVRVAHAPVCGRQRRGHVRPVCRRELVLEGGLPPWQHLRRHPAARQHAHIGDKPDQLVGWSGVGRVGAPIEAGSVAVHGARVPEKQIPRLGAHQHPAVCKHRIRLGNLNEVDAQPRCVYACAQPVVFMMRLRHNA